VFDVGPDERSDDAVLLLSEGDLPAMYGALRQVGGTLIGGVAGGVSALWAARDVQCGYSLFVTAWLQTCRQLCTQRDMLGHMCHADCCR
jgi:hypothetical protein